MSKGINLAVIVGNIGNIEVRDAGGVKLARVSIATTDGGGTDKEGKPIPEETTWHKVLLWRSMAEAIEKYCKKGDKISIRGRMKQRKFKANDCTEHVDYFVVADELEIPNKPKSESAPMEQQNDNYWPFP